MKWFQNKIRWLLFAILIFLIVDISIRIIFKFHLTFYFSPYIGVIIGASLGWIGTLLHTWISTNTEKNKRKAKVKYELYGTYHQYYQYRKAQVVTLNRLQFVGKRFNIYNANKVDPEIIKYNKNELDTLSANNDNIFLLLHKVEADLVSLQHEVSDLFQNEINQEEFDKLLNSIIHEGNTAIYIAMDYTNVTTIEQINNIGSMIDKLIYDQEIKLFEDGEVNKNKLKEILS